MLGVAFVALVYLFAHLQEEDTQTQPLMLTSGEENSQNNVVEWDLTGMEAVLEKPASNLKPEFGDIPHRTRA